MLEGLAVPSHLKETHESIYGSPPNFSLTKSPVFKPTPGRAS